MMNKNYIGCNFDDFLEEEGILAGADRAAMAETLPKGVMEQLVPKEWTER